MKKTIAFAAGLFIAGCIVSNVAGCMHPPTAQQAGAVADAACSLLDVFGGTPEEQAICATAADFIELEATVRASRADAGPEQKIQTALTRMAVHCRIVGTVCATDDEIAAAIKARKVATR